MFENRQLFVFEGKCRRFWNSSEWSVNMWTTNFCRSFSKNILFHINSRLSKIRSVHTYVIPRTVYFGWICSVLPCCMHKSMIHNDWGKIPSQLHSKTISLLFLQSLHNVILWYWAFGKCDFLCSSLFSRKTDVMSDQQT